MADGKPFSVSQWCPLRSPFSTPTLSRSTLYQCPRPLCNSKLDSCIFGTVRKTKPLARVHRSRTIFQPVDRFLIRVFIDAAPQNIFYVVAFYNINIISYTNRAAFRFLRHFIKTGKKYCWNYIAVHIFLPENQYLFPYFNFASFVYLRTNSSFAAV